MEWRQHNSVLYFVSLHDSDIVYILHMHISPVIYIMRVQPAMMLFFLTLTLITITFFFFFSLFSLKNSSGQTAADLAYALGFHNCFHLISKSQLRTLPVTEMQNGDGAPCFPEPRGRKRLLASVDSENNKRVRRADGKIHVHGMRARSAWSPKRVILRVCAVDAWFQMESGGGEEPEHMSTEDGPELHPGEAETPSRAC